MRASTSSWSWIDFGAYPGCLDPQASVEEQLGIAAARVVIADLGAEKKGSSIILVNGVYFEHFLDRDPGLPDRSRSRSSTDQHCGSRGYEFLRF